MHVMVAPGRLRDGVTEEALLEASTRFQRELADGQPGVLRRVLVADPSGGYADIVFFEDEHAIQRAMDAEQHSEAYHHFMGMLDFSDVAVYRALQHHE